MPHYLRGKYRAFCPQHLVPDGAAAGATAGPGTKTMTPPTAGLRHLKGLVDAGLNHIHLLPSYDYGSVPERVEEQAVVTVSDCVRRV